MSSQTASSEEKITHNKERRLLRRMHAYIANVRRNNIDDIDEHVIIIIVVLTRSVQLLAECKLDRTYISIYDVASDR